MHFYDHFALENIDTILSKKVYCLNITANVKIEHSDVGYEMVTLPIENVDDNFQTHDGVAESAQVGIELQNIRPVQEPLVHENSIQNEFTAPDNVEDLSVSSFGDDLEGKFYNYPFSYLVAQFIL